MRSNAFIFYESLQNIKFLKADMKRSSEILSYNKINIIHNTNKIRTRIQLTIPYLQHF